MGLISCTDPGTRMPQHIQIRGYIRGCITVLSWRTLAVDVDISKY